MPHSLKPGDEIVPGYVLVRRLGAGGSGEVWVSRASGGVQVAIKILSDLAMIASDRELEALRIVREAKHPNLCPLFGVWFFDDEHNLLSSKEAESILGTGEDLTETVCLAPTEERESSAEFDPPITETVALSTRKTKPTQMIVAMGLGEQTLMDRLVQVQAEKEGQVAKTDGDDAATGDEQQVGIEPDELLRYMKSAASAIDELNERHNIYHCDIKPQNILLVGGQAQVCDFGLARKVEDSRKTSIAFGTPAYGAPEMLFERTYSRTIDQYSLAVTYYELRTGKLPYSSVTQSSLLRSKATGEVDLSRVPPAEKQVLTKAIDLDPEQRYENCQALVSALEEAIHHPDAVLARSTADRKSLAVPIAAVSAIALLAAIGSWSLFGSSATEPQSIGSAEIAEVEPIASTANEPSGIANDSPETVVATPNSSEGSPSLPIAPELDPSEPSEPDAIINDQLLTIIEADDWIDQRLGDALKTIESPDAKLDQLTEPTLRALIQDVETAAERPLNADGSTPENVIELINNLIPVARDRFTDNSAEVARLVYARLLAALAIAGNGGRSIEAESIDSVRTRFNRQNQYEHQSVSAGAALAIAESWIPKFQSSNWDRVLARDDIARARLLNQSIEENRSAWLGIQTAYLNGLLGARPESLDMTELNAETVRVAKELESDSTSRPVAIAAISLADPSGTSHPTDRIDDDGTIPSGLPDTLHVTYLIGAGWNHWNHDQNSKAVGRWRQASRLPSLTASTADSDRDAAARHLLESLIQLSGIPDQQSSELRYQNRASSIASALAIVATLTPSDSDLVADVSREQFICSVAKGDFDDAEQRLDSISESARGNLPLDPQTGRAVFDLALNRIDAGFETDDESASQWYDRLLQSCNAQTDPNLFGPNRDQSDRARRTRNDLFRRCYRPTMDHLREQIATEGRISARGLDSTALTLFCDRFVSLMTQSDRRAAYGAILPYVRDIELAASIAAPNTENRNRRSELFYLAADALEREFHELNDDRSYSEVISKVKQYRDQAKTKGTTVFTDCLDAMIAQEEAYREVDPQTSLDLSDEAIKNYRNVIFSGHPLPKICVAEPTLDGARVLERKAIMMSGELKETLLDEALDDARRSIELTPEDFQDRESRLENLARVCCEITQITETKKRAEKLELIVEADHAIDEALVIRKNMALDDSQLSTAKLFVLGMIAVVSEDSARNAAVKEAQQWMNKTKDLGEASSSGRIKCAWHYNAAIITERGGDPETAMQHATTAKETADAKLDPSERIAHLSTLAFVNLKSYRLSKGNRAQKLALIKELLADLDGLAKPTPPIANQRDVYRKVLEERRAKL